MAKKKEEMKEKEMDWRFSSLRAAYGKGKGREMKVGIGLVVQLAQSNLWQKKGGRKCNRRKWIGCSTGKERPAVKETGMKQRRPGNKSGDKLKF